MGGGKQCLVKEKMYAPCNYIILYSRKTIAPQESGFLNKNNITSKYSKVICNVSMVKYKCI